MSSVISIFINKVSSVTKAKQREEGRKVSRSQVTTENKNYDLINMTCIFKDPFVSESSL